MSEHYKPEVGDRVRVVLEGVVTQNPNFAPDFTLDHMTWVQPQWPVTKSVEKIEPPVEQFKFGDVVRSKLTGAVYTLTREGYVRHSMGSHFPSLRKFTSEHYEKVDLS